ncbi:hypothetical protein FJY71_00630 [candidate division WOR-3 bacterium]|nr:hypothetical protein [candidate division WOR-3 bacterium]
MDTVKAFLASVLGAVDVPYAEIRLEEAEHSRIVYRGAELDDLGKRLERGGCIRVCDRGNWGVATFNRVDEGLKELAQEVATQVQAMPLREDSLPTLPAYEDVIRVRPEDDPRRVPLAAKNELIRHYNGILLRTAGIETTFSVYLDTHRFVASCPARAGTSTRSRSTPGSSARRSPVTAPTSRTTLTPVAGRVGSIRSRTASRWWRASPRWPSTCLGPSRCRPGATRSSSTRSWPGSSPTRRSGI